MAIFPNQVLSSVLFIGCKRFDTERIETKGTAFVLAKHQTDNPDTVRTPILVTARHVLDGMRARGVTEVYIRFNAKNGGSFWRKSLLQDWILSSSPSKDLAFYPAKMPLNHDHTAIGPNLFNFSDQTPPYEVNLADELAIVGLFSPRTGRNRVTPVVRVATLSAFADPNEHLSADSPDGTRIDDIIAHLVEVRSMAGLSGSPVFALPKVTDILQGKLKNAVSHTFLFGLLSGHYEVSSTDVSSENNEIRAERIKINSGIAYVTPVQTIQDELSQIPDADLSRRLFFPPETDLSEGSMMWAARHLTYDEILQLSQALANPIQFQLSDSGGQTQSANIVRPEAWGTVQNITEKLRQFGWVEKPDDN